MNLVTMFVGSLQASESDVKVPGRTALVHCPDNGCAGNTENYNSLRLLQIPARPRKNFPWSTPIFLTTARIFEAVVINSACPDEDAKPVVWAVNKGGSPRYLNIRFTGLQEPTNIVTRFMKGVPPYEIADDLNYSITPQNPVISLRVPENSIFVAEAIY